MIDHFTKLFHQEKKFTSEFNLTAMMRMLRLDHITPERLCPIMFFIKIEKIALAKIMNDMPFSENKIDNMKGLIYHIGNRR